jgi:flavorubredoxin
MSIGPRTIRPGVEWLGAIDWHRTLFDALIPLPEGTSYNAYFVRGGTRCALLDTVDASQQDALMRQLDALPPVDVVVSHHAEQDHSGALPAVLARYPRAELVCSPKAARMLPDLLEIDPARVRAVADGETLDLGGRALRFVHLPWAHWPETMGTWLDDERILFPCDLFGSHRAASELFAGDDPRVIEAARLYYAQIMMPYAAALTKHLDRALELGPSIIAPSHGPVHDEPVGILRAYESWLRDPPLNKVVLGTVSMHGSTEEMASILTAELMARGVAVEPFDLTAGRLDRLASALVDAGTIAICAPTVWGGPHPHAAAAAYVINGLKPKAGFVAVVGSYGWGGKAAEKLGALLGDTKAEFLPPVLVKGAPRAEAASSLAALAATIAEKHAAAGWTARRRPRSHHGE